MFSKEKITLLVSFFALILTIPGCIEVHEDDVNMTDNSFSFNENFDFSTNKELTLFTNKDRNTFEISYVDFNGESNYLGKFNNNADQLNVIIPSYVSELEYVEYIEGVPSKASFTISEEQASLNLPSLNSSARTENSCIDRLYAVNGDTHFFEIDVTNENFNMNALPNLYGGGSYACALDQENQYVYYNPEGGIYRYDIVSNQFETTTIPNPYNKRFPRFEYKNDTFYMGDNKTMYTIKASTGQIIKKYNISGFVNSDGGGDLAFDSEGVLYLACFSGLYKFTNLDSDNGVASITRISAENFPFQLTSMAIDRQDRIFVATTDTNSKLIEISKEDGAYTIVKTFDRKINDLTAWKCEFDTGGEGEEGDNDGDGVPDVEDDDMDGDGIIDEKDDDVDGDGTPNTEDDDMDGDGTPNDQDNDIDGDGVINPLDDYPEDPAATGSIYTPSKLGFGTLAFEDNWPSKQDYDFNDMVIKYKVTSMINKDNKAIQMNIELKLVAAGGDYRNGFGIELPIQSNQIDLVSGHNAPGSTIDQSGLEIGQTNPVIIAFTDALRELGGSSVVNADPAKPTLPIKTYNIVVEFSELIDANLISDAPFNPFIFINGDRGRECHLRNKPPTDLMDKDYFGSNDDDSNVGLERFFVSDDNVPFAINIAHSFRYPHEGVRIDRAYNHFLTWGKADGTSYKNWYSDANGYRNTNKIFFIED